ncbi:MAG: hypothetical protein R6U68_16590, partial [Desulfobacteraceae bacterium]
MFDLSGQLDQYTHMRIAENPHKLKSLKIATSSGSFELNENTSNKEVTQEEAVRIQIRLAFIFSHSALREGWDNPNIFTLCTLKVSASEIAKKQEIGRGLRLPVDIHGKRIKDETINELTVIANDHYDHFAETLQSDFNESMDFNKDEVTAQILANSLIQAGIPVEKITPELVNDFKNELHTHKIINDKNILTRVAEKIETIDFANETLKEHAIHIRNAFVEL